MATACSLQQYGRPPPFINLRHKQQHSLSNCSSRIGVMVGNRSVMLQGFGNNNSSKAATAGMVVKCSGIGIGGSTVFVIAAIGCEMWRSTKPLPFISVASSVRATVSLTSLLVASGILRPLLPKFILFALMVISTSYHMILLLFVVDFRHIWGSSS
ncbi:hypothetical protein D5086_033950 [Populus alba]|uniref:Uncharacterized protein n=1 Tax=Populus alba TaxID=43335 RepID=A0ACC4AIB0_POPAL